MKNNFKKLINQKQINKLSLNIKELFVNYISQGTEVDGIIMLINQIRTYGALFSFVLWNWGWRVGICGTNQSS